MGPEGAILGVTVGCVGLCDGTNDGLRDGLTVGLTDVNTRRVGVLVGRNEGESVTNECSDGL